MSTTAHTIEEVQPKEMPGRPTLQGLQSSPDVQKGFGEAVLVRWGHWSYLAVCQPGKRAPCLGCQPSAGL